MLLILMILSAFAEIISIGAVLPFLGVLIAPAKFFESPAVQPIIQSLGFIEPKQLLLLFTVAFGMAALLAGSSRLLLLWASTRLSFAAGADLGANIYLRTLYQPYSVHIARNSSEIIEGISGKSSAVIFNAILPALTLIGSAVMIISILIALLSIEPIVALSSAVVFGLIYAIIIYISRNQLIANSRIAAQQSPRVIKSLQEGLGGIRDVLLDGSQATYCHIYQQADYPIRRAQGNTSFIGASPRFALEAFGMLLISVLSYSLAQQQDGVANAIPILGGLALGAQRLLPVLQQAYNAWSNIQGGRVSLQDTLELLDQPLPQYANQPSARPIPFREQISAKKLSYRYGIDMPLVINNLDITITKGSRIGIIGSTGSGKSTLVDILMSLLLPTKGTLEIDGQPITSENYRSWQAHIAHVPQAIYLADCTIEENIAFGISKDKINDSRVRQAARQAQIADTIESWPLQYQTNVGENGIRLSGGQRQRIGIARALYKEADVIVFDEATSALDNETEEAVMQAIETLSDELTLIIVAHRLTTLRKCTQIVELYEGRILRTGTYQKIVN
jgi:ATP-binding cassette subfamily B protein